VRHASAVAAAALLVSAGCARCGTPKAVPPERFLPADAPLAVVVPRLGAAAEALRPLARTVESVPAAAGVVEALAAVRAQLGFDPLDERGLADAGLDPKGGAALALAPGASPLLVLPVGDEGRLEALLARLARDRLGAGSAERAGVAGAPVTTWRTRPGAPPALALAVTQRTALLARGPDAPARVTAAAARIAGEALAGNEVYARARRALGDGAPAALAFAPAGSPYARRASALRDGGAVGLTADGARLVFRTALLLSPERAQAWRAVLGAGPAPAGSEALARVPRDAFLAVRFDGDPVALGRRLAWSFPDAAARLTAAGLDLEADLLATLAPGAAAALSLAPTFEVAAVSRGAGALGEADPFRLGHAVAVLPVRDAARARAALDKLAAAAPALGLEAEAPPAGRYVWTFRRGAAEVGVALDGARLLLAGGEGRLERLRAGDAPPYAAPTVPSRVALAGGAAGGVLDVARLVASFRALPEAAYGTGPDAFVMRSLAERVVDPASRLLAATLRADLVEGAARLDLTLELAPPPGDGAR
jgi:hypothetical protein